MYLDSYSRNHDILSHAADHRLGLPRQPTQSLGNFMDIHFCWIAADCYNIYFFVRVQIDIR